ncbi:D-tyrosyl-tRNA(Tyr) deacylase [Candidatus Gottesmanbacteria bacterium]|nr:D-tyrosyl-tRNA(Tyr) deacylase [Candidatus Gottesmanbacteria bacterium]MBI5465424.1 D-tyrosyl-tRNA(Tyr) deacylase [Candidatus Gottesmanbacteria bacterium]
MRALIQRVNKGKVTIGGKVVGEIGKGMVILLGVANKDTEKEADFLAEKVVNLRIMADSAGKMNLSIKDVDGEILVVSQFTLYGDASGGRRPSFIQAASPDLAKRLYERFIEKLGSFGIKVATGRFGEYMELEIINDGPVTIMLDSKDLR